MGWKNVNFLRCELSWGSLWMRIVLWFDGWIDGEEGYCKLVCGLDWCLFFMYMVWVYFLVFFVFFFVGFDFLVGVDEFFLYW